MRNISVWMATFALVTGLATSLSAAPVDLRLAEAAQRDDLAAARTLVKQKADLNAQQSDGMSALIWAAHNDNVELADLLLKAGANIKTVNRYGVAALTEAAQNGSAAMLELLLKAGADPNTKLPEGDTALMLASRAGNAAAVKVLLDHKAAVDVKEDWHGETALMWAAGENHADVVKLLIKAGADPNAKATHLVYPTMVNAPAGVYSKYPTGGLTALIQAARENAFEAALALLENGADPNIGDARDLSPLQTAVGNAHWDMAQLLLDHGADPNDGSLFQAVDVRNSAGFVRAASNRPDKLSAMDLINVFVQKGVKIDSPLKVLFPAQKALGGAATAPPDASPLYRAAKAADTELITYFVSKGANPNIVLKDGSTPLMAAAGLGTRAGTGFGPKVATEEEMLKAVQFFLDHGAEVNAQESTGQTALHVAAARGVDQVVQLLADHGAKLDILDKRERTALDIANASNGKGAPPSLGGNAGRLEKHPTTAALLRKLMGLPAEEQTTAKPAETSGAGQ
jgi:ankyrin repeat protein